MNGDRPNTLGGGRYRLSGLLGSGGMAEVRKAEDLRLGRTVAIKELRPDLAGDPTFQARFRREAQSAASLNHPTIVAVYDTGEEEATDGSGLLLPYIVMEYVEGRTLRDILREGRKILPERALEIASSVLDALDYSHRAGIIHRDIKPANVMLTPAGDIKVMDFGIARAISDASATMTQTAAVIGTAQYLSPEQARGEQVDARSDLYSTGCLLFELLTGRPPFIGDSPVSVAYQHVREEPPAPSSIDRSISPAIDAITMKSLTKPVDERYQSAAEMRSDIARALGGRPVLAPAVYATSQETAPFLPPLPRDPATSVTTAIPPSYDESPPRRRTGLVIALLLLVAALVIAGAIVVPKLLSNDPAAESTVPTLRNLTVAQARQKLDARNLTLVVEDHKNSSDIAADHIIDQSILAGEKVEEGTEIDVTVSSGERTETIPYDVVNGNVSTAEATLKDLGFEVTTKEDPDSLERRNQVTTTDPEPGQTVPYGSAVTVFYSKGYTVVKNVVGMTQDEAIKVLTDQGFKPVPTAVVSDADAGTVTAQDPQGGERVQPGTTIVISVSLGPTETSTVPTTTTPSTETTPPTESTDTTDTSDTTTGTSTTSEGAPPG